MVARKGKPGSLTCVILMLLAAFHMCNASQQIMCDQDPNIVCPKNVSDCAASTP